MESLLLALNNLDKNMIQHEKVVNLAEIYILNNTITWYGEEKLTLNDFLIQLIEQNSSLSL